MSCYGQDKHIYKGDKYINTVKKERLQKVLDSLPKGKYYIETDINGKAYRCRTIRKTAKRSRVHEII